MKNLMLKLMLCIAILIVDTNAKEPPSISELGFERSWFKPILVESNNSICETFLEVAQRSFFSDSSTPENSYGNLLERIAGYKVQAGSLPINEIPLSIENKKIYMTYITHHGCGGACEKVQIITSGKLIDANKRFGNDFNSDFLKTMPEATDYGQSFFMKAKNGSYYISTITNELNIYQLKSDASWEKECKISIKPTRDAYLNLKDGAKTLETINSLKDELDGIMGKYGHTCGSMASGYRRKVLLEDLLERVTYRPWGLYGYNPYSHLRLNRDESLEYNFLYDWSKRGVHQYQVYKNFSEKLKIVIPALSNFYQTNYGWNRQQSDDVATVSLMHAISNSFRGVSETKDFNRSSLIGLILDKAGISKIEEISLENIKDDTGQDYFGDSMAALSVNYPEALEYLLQKDFSPNTANHFGKTPLMYAAQYNQAKSLEILLKYNANPNSVTNIPADSCNYTLSKSGMTALHYAVRYSSSEIINMLLSAGANPYALTSERDGGRPIDWLNLYVLNPGDEKNPNLSVDEAEKLKPKLALPSDEELHRLVKKYNLEAERLFQEGKKEEAYISIKKAINLDPFNDRALANLALIAIRTGRIMESLEASQKVIDSSKDTLQKANAWFNYALACEENNIYHDYYNGKSYCTRFPLYYLIESYKLKSSAIKAERIAKSFKENKLPNCHFKGDIHLTNKMSKYGSEKGIYILYPKTAVIDKSKIFWMEKEKLTRLEKIVETYDLGEYVYEKYQSSGYVHAPIYFDDQQCVSDSYGVFQVR